MAAVFVGLGFHVEIAGSIALAFFYGTFGLWAAYKKRITPALFLLGVGIVGCFFVPHLVSEAQSDFAQTRVLVNEIGNPHGIFSGSAFSSISKELTSTIVRSISLQTPQVSVILFGAIVWLVAARWQIRRKRHIFIKRFFLLCLGLVVVTWAWFSTNLGWRSWQTVYMSPLLYVAVLLALFDIPKKIGYTVLAISLVSHAILFWGQYDDYVYGPTADASILHNELAAIDWVYQKADRKGFSVYNYLPSVYDYPYQYLFWWHGRKTYGYLPCEYASFPGAPGLFVPGKIYYQEPTRGCPTSARFLIVEPDDNRDNRRRWLDAVKHNTTLLEESDVGNIHLEKRVVL
ncbi:hypothetical protein HY086_03740 [Candidatus Gottesmanbacteria bacterium]|nr:hypothetical protein [Candidatus Gottesmanbacteria bacterium]